ncbi:hypothetical protein G6F29_010227 [Rhizopus arrhizus]|nr:hypothetical protein G6F23_011201 [Rhizopus arrhizus]KAG0834854.1 hypothetical protein G6F19_004992 [Rhizopus arrhizus]KAG0836504.1 hypothetical protein G6F18_005309 [Rhizopus arrhizus]KAG0855568.1 hypothetical protein G6F17_005347 [Rhizopus arrhizus]KAG0884444.1 hypothetical protein G6F15_005089 [Rhizopus arrhizus]
MLLCAERVQSRGAIVRCESVQLLNGLGYVVVRFVLRMKLADSFMIHSGVLGIKVKIRLDNNPTGRHRPFLMSSLNLPAQDFRKSTRDCLMNKKNNNWMDLLQSLPGAWIEDDNIKREEKEDVDLLKQTIETLRKEQERLEETNHVVKKSIEIVAEKRLLAEKAKKDRKMDDYILINSQEHIPSQEELMAAGLEGWEWVSTAC